MDKKINFDKSSVKEMRWLDVTEIQKRMKTLSFLNREQIKIRKYRKSINEHEKWAVS